jgi:hypothetical protein
MKPRRLLLWPLLLATALAGCGQGGGDKTPDSSKLPLVAGARILQQIRRCDPGANAFCALELVVVDPSYHSSLDFLAVEQHHLLTHGWTGASPPIGEERAADSPGHKLHITYATAYGDLKGIDLGWIHRTHRTAVALSHALFDHASTISVLLEMGPS